MIITIENIRSRADYELSYTGERVSYPDIVYVLQTVVDGLGGDIVKFEEELRDVVGKKGERYEAGELEYIEAVYSKEDMRLCSATCARVFERVVIFLEEKEYVIKVRKPKLDNGYLVLEGDMMLLEGIAFQVVAMVLRRLALKEPSMMQMAEYYKNAGEMKVVQFKTNKLVPLSDNEARNIKAVLYNYFSKVDRDGTAE